MGGPGAGRVQVHAVGGRGADVGPEEEQPGHDLREAQQSHEVSIQVSTIAVCPVFFFLCVCVYVCFFVFVFLIKGVGTVLYHPPYLPQPSLSLSLSLALSVFACVRERESAVGLIATRKNPVGQPIRSLPVQLNVKTFRDKLEWGREGRRHGRDGGGGGNNH